MAYQKLQVSRTLTVIPSDNTLIPFPGAKYLESTTTGTAANKLIDVLESGTNSTDGTTLTDVTKNFITAGVLVGDTVEDTTSGDLATITAVGVTTLTLDTDIFPVAGRPYSLGSFIRLGVEPGDIIYNYDSSEAATVIEVDSGTELTVNFAAGITNGDDYILFKKDQNNGCVFYIGTATAGQAVQVQTSGGDIQLIPNVVQGSYQPVSIKQLYASNTTASNIIALW